MSKTTYTGARSVDPQVRAGGLPSLVDFVCIDSAGNRIDPASRAANVPFPIGDGASHPVSDFIGAGKAWADLAACQEDYPLATSTGNALSGQALANMLTSRADGSTFAVDVPPGHYLVDQTIDIGTRRITIHMHGARIDTSVPLISVSPSSNHDVEDGGGYAIDGHDPSASSIHFTGASGSCLDFTRVVKGGVANLTLREASGNGVGVNLYSSDQIRLRNLHLFGFDTSIKLSGPGKAGYSGATYTRTNSCYLNDLFIRDYATCAMDFSYCEEIFLTNVQSYVEKSTHAGKYAMKIGTCAFAVYGQTISLMGGGLKIYWVPDDSSDQELPPNWLMFDNLLCDWPFNIPALTLDDSLYIKWNSSLPGRGYRFANSWFAATDYGNGGEEPFEKLDALPNVYIGGGYDIEFCNTKVRFGKGHGVYVANCLGDLRFSNCSIYANGTGNPNFVDTSGIYIHANAGPSGTPGPDTVLKVLVTGGTITNTAADLGGFQKYGVYKGSRKVQLVIAPGTMLRGNTVAEVYSV